MDITELILDDHRQQRAAFARLTKSIALTFGISA